MMYSVLVLLSIISIIALPAVLVSAIKRIVDKDSYINQTIYMCIMAGIIAITIFYSH